MTKSTGYFQTAITYQANAGGNTNSSGYSIKKSSTTGNSGGGDDSGFFDGGKPKRGNSGGGDDSGFFDGGKPKRGNSGGGDDSGFFDGGKPKRGNSGGGDDSGFFGGGKPKHGNSGGGDDSGFFTGDKPKGGNSHGGNSNGNQPFGNQVITGTSGNDILQGNRYGIDTLVGTTEVARGVGERDILIGGCARDTFVLGDAEGSFYLGNGSNDYAEIKNFSRSNDSIQLAGSIQDYSISYANGISSVFHKDPCGCLDLVAQVNSACSPLDLNGTYFQYTPQCDNGAVSMG